MSRPPRVLHVLGGAGLGGTERQLLRLLPELARNVDASLVLIRGGELAPRFAAAVPTTIVAKRWKADPLCLAQVIRHVRAARPDVVQTWGATAGLWGAAAAHLAHAPAVVMCDRSIDAWKGRVLRGADRVLYRRADAVVGNSQAVVDAAVSRGADPTRALVIPNAVDVPEPDARPREPDLIAYVGRLHPDKGPDVALEAFARLADDHPSARLVLAGPAVQPVERELAARLRHRIVALGVADRVDLPGPLADPTLLLNRAAVLVLPSRTEGLSNVLLEAIVCGTPVVATAVGGTPEVVRDRETGRLVPPEDPEALTRALAEVLAQPTVARRWAARGRAEVVERYGIGAVVEQWLDLYARLVPTPGSSQ